MDFESRMLAVKGIVEAVGEANINVIGIWGMPCVGKTTLVREVAREAKEQKLIDEVALADVTQSPEVGRIQGEIADMLDLKLDKRLCAEERFVYGRGSQQKKRRRILFLMFYLKRKNGVYLRRLLWVIQLMTLIFDARQLRSLKSVQEVQYFFLHCALMGYGIDNLDLLKYCYGLGLFRGIKSLDAARNRVYSLAGNLKDSGLLKDCPHTCCSKLEVIPPNVLSSLVELEDLYIGSSFVEWEAEGLNNERTNASLSELKQLSQKLTTLEIHIQEASILPKDLLFLKLERFKVFVGDVWEWSDKHETARTLKLKLNTSFHLEVGIKMLLQRTEALYLDELKGVKSVLDELDKEGFQQLKHLHIQNNAEIKHIISSRISVTAFPALGTFVLKNMINLEEICLVQLSLRSFRNLRVVKVGKCQKLKSVFSSSIAMGLCLLEELEVREYSIMGAIAMEKDQDGMEDHEDMKLFPPLKRLVLEHLPMLMGFVGTQNEVTADPKDML
ncbi:hypothetical protein CJ030_MR8G022382 [Morella rubra]|uniref:Uncharacterized protein n=1 Tax=Morella rubra TaxID=262757 RepID=A0A6A1UR01_9ROSI|nr:hypothetical protein CJ030_MR8G022382 [Morella rubra]